MPIYRCLAWTYSAGPPEVNDIIAGPKLIFAETRPLAITKFIDGEVIPQNADLDPPYDLANIEIGVEVIPEVPNWQP